MKIEYLLSKQRKYIGTYLPNKFFSIVNELITNLILKVARIFILVPLETNYGCFDLKHANLFYCYYCLLFLIS